MNRRGVEYTAVQVEPSLWRWQFQIGDTATTGTTQTKLKGMTTKRAEIRIDHELKRSRERQERIDSAGSPDAP
jgi:hypothetical protein